MLNVFYLDDELELCENFKELFSTSEISITYFTEAEKLTAAIQISMPDMVFIDFRLPHTNGDKIAQTLAIKQPIFLITGDLYATVTYPFQKIFSKPFVFDEIKSVLDEHVELKKKHNSN